MSYTEEDIEVLSDRDHVRKRLPIYAGSTSMQTYDFPVFDAGQFNTTEVSFIPAVHKCVMEVLDNSIDEFAQNNIKRHQLTIGANPVLGIYTISDNGRGVPIGKHSSGKYTPEVVFSSLRTGRNFSDDKTTGVIGMNGMGSSITCFCSNYFKVTIQRDNKKYNQMFSSGATQITEPSIVRHPSQDTGTTIEFELDNTLFADTTLPSVMMEGKAQEIALTNPGVHVTYNGKKFLYKHGFDDIMKKMSSNYYKFSVENLDFFVVFDVHEGIDEKIYSWVNSSLLFDGGLCNTQFLNAFYEKTTQHLQPQAKKHKCEVNKNDIKQNLLVFGNLRLDSPEYDAQSKNRLTGPNLRKEFIQMIHDQWGVFAKKNTAWLSEVLERANTRHHAQANSKAVSKYKKQLSKNIPGLIDATSKNRGECQILITEGLSAAAQITQVRNPQTTASLPLTGKINNVYGSTTAQVLKMSKITGLLSAIGLIPGQRALRGNLNYGKIIIASDADPDGDDICVLLVNLFFSFWPELFDIGYQPIIYRLVAPNICLVKGKERIHFSSREEYDKEKAQYKGYDVNYFKGLGSMTKSDWDIILKDPSKSLLPIIDDGGMADVMSLLFGPSADARKKWLQEK